MDALDRIRQVSDISILLVEQNARAALNVADYCYVMHAGRISLEGPAADMVGNPEVQRLYLGRSGARRYGAPLSEVGPT
jgi:branched-chain amino acid transport system ATP-binding protein